MCRYFGIFSGIFFFFFKKKDNFFCACCLTKTKQLLISASIYYDIYSTVRVGEGGCEFDLLLHCVGIIDLGRQFMGQSASCTVVKCLPKLKVLKQLNQEHDYSAHDTSSGAEKGV